MLQCTPENGRRHTYQTHHRDQTMRSRTPLQFASLFQLSTADLQLFRTNSFRFTHFRKNASANPLESHTFKTKDLKPFRFTHFQKKGRGWVPFSNIQPQTSNLCSSLSPLASALTSKRASKSFTSNTYEKHTGGGGGRRLFFRSPDSIGRVYYRISRFEFRFLPRTKLRYPPPRKSSTAEEEQGGFRWPRFTAENLPDVPRPRLWQCRSLWRSWGSKPAKRRSPNRS